MPDLHSYLTKLGIAYTAVEHPPVATCDEASRLVPTLPGCKVKNLFLRNRKGNRHFLVLTLPDKEVNLKALAAALGVDGVGFASPERLERYLRIKPGAVSVLALINDTEHAVELVIAEEVWQAENLQCHPLVNTATAVLPHTDLERLLTATGHSPLVLSLDVLHPDSRSTN